MGRKDLISKRVFSYWYQGQLRRTDWLCLESWVRHGFEATLYSHDPQTRVPAGVTWADASLILPIALKDKMLPLRGGDAHRAVVSFSDLIRMKGMQRGLGLWLDTDVYLLKPFTYDVGEPFLGWEGFNRIGASVIYVPPQSAFCRDYAQVFDDVERVPSWVEWRKATWRPLKWRLQGLPFRPGDLGITIFGNYAFTRLGRKYYRKSQILPKNRFYAWTGKHSQRFYTDPQGLDQLTAQEAWGIHVHRKFLDSKTPIPGSLYETALRTTAYPS